ncbi:hypothetical protein GEV43_12880 [Actinomadura sp. J1-007]|uniref:hypothetical protein n=1 Tax=Actinomadura sp. J1-007 TaxID=2661913 RepID=UPI00132A04E7|nr:hypothetical protein [Actinomadura sp. J1-007]MWK34843.1 hypothetical protein [Actinomadura sp. J1-007]
MADLVLRDLAISGKEGRCSSPYCEASSRSTSNSRGSSRPAAISGSASTGVTVIFSLSTTAE